MGDEHPLKLVCLKMGFIPTRHFQWQNHDIDQLMEWGIGIEYLCGHTKISKIVWLPTHIPLGIHHCGWFTLW
jgi:hypothetical protein